MIIVEKGKEQEEFLTFMEHAITMLSEEQYEAFIALFDDSRMSEKELILALKYLDETCSAVKIDNPKCVKKSMQRVDLIFLRDGSGYCMDYDLFTEGQPNDLTVQIEFKKEKEGFFVTLEDIHTL